MEVDPFGRCADVRTDADRWTHSHIHTQIKGMILWMSAISLDSRRLCKSVCMREWMSDGVCVRRHTVEAHHSVYLSRTLVTVMYSPAYSLHPNHPRSCNSQKTGDQNSCLKKTHTFTHTQSNTGSTEQQCGSDSVGCRKANSKTAPPLLQSSVCILKKITVTLLVWGCRAWATKLMCWHMKQYVMDWIMGNVPSRQAAEVYKWHKHQPSCASYPKDFNSFWWIRWKTN